MPPQFIPVKTLYKSEQTDLLFAFTTLSGFASTLESAFLEENSSVAGLETAAAPLTFAVSCGDCLALFTGIHSRMPPLRTSLHRLLSPKSEKQRIFCGFGVRYWDVADLLARSVDVYFWVEIRHRLAVSLVLFIHKTGTK